MQKRLLKSLAVIIPLALLIVALPLLGACSGTEEPTMVTQLAPMPALSPEPIGFDAIHEGISGYLNSGSTWNIKAEDLFLLLNDEDTGNDPFIISVCTPEDYAKGHIPGAVNIAFGDIVKNGTLNALPKDKKIVVYCYTGQSGSQATAMLGALGFDAINLLHGMSAWTKDTEVAPKRFTPETAKDYAFETTPNEASDDYPYPTIDKSVKGAAQAYTSAKNIKAEDLFLLLNDDATSNDPFIVSFRKPEDYAKGHIPGAVNIGFTDLAKKDTLANLPPDRPIVAYCYTGQTGSQATALLNMLGYDATNLLYGMCSWTQNAEVATKCFDNETASMDYEFELTPNIFVPKEEPGAEPIGFDAIHEGISGYLNSGSTWNIKAEDLFLLLNDEDTGNDPFIISVCTPEDYAKGHIPGAVNIAFGDIVKNGTLNALPKDKKIVVYCYTGQSGSQATAMLGALGFDAINLLHGMSAWTKDTEVAPKRFTPETAKDYAFETTPNEASDDYPYPTIDKSVKGAAQAYTSAKNIKAEDLFLLLNDDATSNDPFIVSFRKPEDYAKGHIPGAVNIGFTDLAKKDTLANLPPDRPIVAYCYTGQTGSQATALLNMLGYDATNLLYGMCSWTQNAEVATKCFDNETASMDYEFELTPNIFVPKEEPATPPEGEPQPPPEGALVMAVDTCVACHSSQALLEEVASPEVEEKSEETSGEG